jgi:tetratricopeptide (TPR) repeat protein
MPECLNGSGLVALAHNDEERARSFFTKALRQDNDFSQARNNLGVIYFSHGDFDTALKYFNRSLEIDPSNTDARYNCGLSNFRLAERMRAQSHNNKSIVYLLVAKDQIKKLLAIEPTYHHAFRDLGLIELNLYDLGNIEEEKQEYLAAAKHAFSQCIETTREEDGCYEGLAQVNFEEGRFDQSFANYFLCLTYASNNSACRNGIVIAYEKSAHAENGYKKFIEHIAQDPRNAYAHEAFCAALFERGLDREALKECEIAVRIKPDLCSVQFRLAEYFVSIFNTERAITHCQSFLLCARNGTNRETKKCQEILITTRR